jgi:hypothetical protein
VGRRHVDPLRPAGWRAGEFPRGCSTLGRNLTIRGFRFSSVTRLEFNMTASALLHHACASAQTVASGSVQ